MTILFYGLIPFVAAVLGAIVTAVRKPVASVGSAIQHFAAGVVFSVVAVELLPDVMRKHKPVLVIIGFGVGIGTMLLLRSISRKLEAKAEGSDRSIPLSMLAAVATDILIDGFLVGTVFRAGLKQGKLLTFALSIELLSLGLAMTAILGNRGLRPLPAIGITAGVSSSMLVGTLAGFLLLARVSDSALEVVLSFGLAALLFLVTEELLSKLMKCPKRLGSQLLSSWVFFCFWCWE